MNPTLEQSSADQAREFLNPAKIFYNRKLDKFKPKLRFSFTVGQYTVRTAQNIDELKMALKLRHEIFLEEALNKSTWSGLDVDKYDSVADHILLIDNLDDQLIGTYRILSSDLVSKFYSSTEFTTQKFLNLPGLKLELGRACIHKSYRKSGAIHLIWKGLGRYAALTSADYMFGCTSVKTDSKFLLQRTLMELGESYCSETHKIKARLKYKFFIEKNRFLDELTDKDIIPPLLSSYLKAGAKVFGEPAYDRSFNCFDIFTCLDLKQIPESYKKRFFKI